MDLVTKLGYDIYDTSEVRIDLMWLATAQMCQMFRYGWRLFQGEIEMLFVHKIEI